MSRESLCSETVKEVQRSFTDRLDARHPREPHPGGTGGANGLNQSEQVPRVAEPLLKASGSFGVEKKSKCRKEDEGVRLQRASSPMW